MREDERGAKRKSYDGERKRKRDSATGGAGVRGERATLSVAAHFSSLDRLVFSKRNGGRASGCTTVVRTPLPNTRVILYISGRARVPARDGEGYIPRCYPLGHSISRVRGTLVITLALRRIASRRVSLPRVFSIGGDAPLPVN